MIGIQQSIVHPYDPEERDVYIYSPIGEGPQGEPAGFGTPTASVDEGTGTPSVTVEASGPDTEKVFDFAFKNLKGTPAGFDTPTASIDNNVGMPSVAITTTGPNTAKKFDFAFKNLKGEKGDKGDTGSRGPAGVQGEQGIRGEKGDAGTTGIDDQATGTLVTMDDAIAAPLIDAKVYGAYEQETTRGANLIPIKPPETLTRGGITYTSNGDGSYTIDGTLTATISSYTIGSSIALTAGDYTISVNGQLPSSIKLVVASFTLKPHVRASISSGSTTFNIPSDITDGEVYFMIDETNQINSITMRPQLEAGTEATPYEPYTGGIPSPNPDYPQEVKTVEGNTTLVVVGKNLATTEIWMQDAMFSPVNVGDTMETSLYAITEAIPVEPLQDYTMTIYYSTRPSVSVSAVWYTHDMTPISLTPFNVLSSSSQINSNEIGSGWIVTAKKSPENAAYVRFSRLKGMTLQFELGTEATKYEPYHKTATTLDLKQSEFRLERNFIGALPDGTKDELSIDASGHMVLNKRVGRFILNGTDESTQLFPIDKTGLTRFEFPGPYFNFDKSKPVSGVHYPVYDNFIASQGYYNNITLSEIFNVATEGASCFFTTASNPSQPESFSIILKESTLDEANSRLQSNPITVYYPLSVTIKQDLGYIDPPAIDDGATVYLESSTGVTAEVSAHWWTKGGAAVYDSLVATKAEIADEYATKDDVADGYVAKGDIFTKVFSITADIESGSYDSFMLDITDFAKENTILGIICIRFLYYINEKWMQWPGSFCISNFDATWTSANKNYLVIGVTPSYGEQVLSPGKYQARVTVSAKKN